MVAGFISELARRWCQQMKWILACSSAPIGDRAPETDSRIIIHFAIRISQFPFPIANAIPIPIPILLNHFHVHCSLTRAHGSIFAGSTLQIDTKLQGSKLQDQTIGHHEVCRAHDARDFGATARVPTTPAAHQAGSSFGAEQRCKRSRDAIGQLINISWGSITITNLFLCFGI